ncbi:RICIN domain-containing protein [Kitasatospora sp. CM 4170]|uniref:RICIN domain-containing protein n=1 Tax=Kitasatospora aburaviensis TaxID=67265 RepID=A0ABW1ERQ8_9ACTN|nr:RICIN domain-containing protein [Kitasatospora sp. CM 4170]WNM44379.1 RICIN domain-containing protein [Kitasatospora sp. CM 4170]
MSDPAAGLPADSEHPRSDRARSDHTLRPKASTALQAFRRLPATVQADLRRNLEMTSEPDPSASTSDADTLALPPLRHVQGFFDAYLQVHALHTPRRECRQLTARLGDAVRRGDDRDHGLERHLARCPDCARARTELTAVHTWQRPVLRAALQVRTGTPDPVPPAAAAVPPSPAATPPVPDPPPAPPVHAPRAAPLSSLAATVRRLRPSDRTVLFGLVVLGVGALTVATAAAVAPGRSGPHGAAAQSAPPSAPPPIRPSDRASVRTSAPRSAQSPPSPSPSGASPADRPAGLRLVNLRANLCVSPGDGTGAGVRLQACTDGDPQRWQFIGDGNGLYRIRNAADGRCLDGTTGGGDTVTVLLRDCRADHREQLWRLVADRSPTVFRIHLASPVASSGYADHLLGPGDIWPGPATYGSPLVHQPNYDNKEDFLFTTS